MAMVGGNGKDRRKTRHVERLEITSIFKHMATIFTPKREANYTHARTHGYYFYEIPRPESCYYPFVNILKSERPSQEPICLRVCVNLAEGAVVTM